MHPGCSAICTGVRSTYAPKSRSRSTRGGPTTCAASGCAVASSARVAAQCSKVSRRDGEAPSWCCMPPLAWAEPWAGSRYMALGCSSSHSSAL
eukprot:scaffold113540_cov69-Phaeocystis_antarctica.AAC.2